MSAPLVSIVIPIYNASETLRQCLDSILAQSYQNLEIMAINDGSTDDSLEILESYAAVEKRIVIINQQNQGLASVRNLGIEKACGTYIMFVDSDDWIDSNTVEQLVLWAERDNLDVVLFPYISEHSTHSDKHVLYPQSHVFTQEEVTNLAKRMIGPTGAELTNVVALDSYSTMWGKLYRHSVVKSFRCVSISIVGTAEDALFNAECFERVASAAYVDTCWYHYRKSQQQQLTTSFKPYLFNQIHCLYEHMEKFADSDTKNQALQNRIACNLFGMSYNATDRSLSLLQQYRCLREIVFDETFHTALCRVEMSYLPIYWRLFLLSGRYKLSLIIILYMKLFRFLMR